MLSFFYHFIIIRKGTELLRSEGHINEVSRGDYYLITCLSLPSDPYQDIISQISRVLDFIRRAIVHRGKVYSKFIHAACTRTASDVMSTSFQVLVYSERGVSRSVAMVIAYLIDTREMSFYEAFIFVREKR